MLLAETVSFHVGCMGRLGQSLSQHRAVHCVQTLEILLLAPHAHALLPKGMLLQCHRQHFSVIRYRESRTLGDLHIALAVLNGCQHAASNANNLNLVSPFGAASFFIGVNIRFYMRRGLPRSLLDFGFRCQLYVRDNIPEDNSTEFNSG